MRFVLRLGLTALLLTVETGFSAEERDTTAPLPSLSSGPLNDGQGVALVHAGTDKKIAYIRSRNRTLGKTPIRWNMAFQAPFDPDDDPAILGNFDGLTTSSNIELNLQYIRIDRDVERDPNDEYSRAVGELCARYGLPAREGCGRRDVEKQIKDKKDPEELCKDLAKPACEVLANEKGEEFRNERVRILRQLEGDKKVNILDAWIFGGGGKVGVEQFKFLDPTSFDSIKTDKSPWSVYGHVFYKRGADAYGIGFDFQESYQPQPTSTVCRPSETDPSISVCSDGAVGAPMRQRRKIVYFEYNRHRRGDAFAISPRLSYDFEKEETGIHFPAYLIRDEKGLFTGGIQIGWQSESDEVVTGIFVGKAFSYF